MKFLLLLGLVCLALGSSRCRTRTEDEIKKAAPERIVWTPLVRKGTLVSNTFFPGCEFAGLLNNGDGLENVLPCVMTSPEHVGGETTFYAVRGGIDNSVFPAVVECKSSTGESVKSLRDVKGDVLVVAHGNSKHARVDVGFGPNGDDEYESFSPDELAEALVRDGLSCEHQRIVLLIVAGGMKLSRSELNKRFIDLYRRIRLTKSKEEKSELRERWAELGLRRRDPELFESTYDSSSKEIPYVTMLALALAERGIDHAEVVGFRGEVSSHMARGEGSGLFKGLRVFVTSKQLARDRCQDFKGDAKHKCVDRLLAPCDDCMLKTSGTQANFHARLQNCRNQLLRGDKDEREAASVCGTEGQTVTDEWAFTVKTEDVKEN